MKLKFKKPKSWFLGKTDQVSQRRHTHTHKIRISKGKGEEGRNRGKMVKKYKLAVIR